MNTDEIFKRIKEESYDSAKSNGDDFKNIEEAISFIKDHILNIE